MKQVLLAILVSLYSLSFSHAALIELRADNGSTKFTAIGKPAMLRISGQGAGPTGNMNIENQMVKGELSVALQTLQTGLELRDDHMKTKYLEVGTYSLAQLSLNNVSLEKPLTEIKDKKVSQKFTGVLTLHGVSKPVEGTFDLEPEGNKIKITALFALNLSDFKIDIPSYMGIKVADKVDIETSFSFTK